MNWELIISSAFSSSFFLIFLGALGYFLREQFSNYFEKRMQFRFEKQIELFRSDIAANQAKIDALRRGALETRAQRQNVIDRRRIDAVDQLWASVKELQKLRWSYTIMAPFRWPEASKLAQGSEKAKQMFQNLGANVPNFNEIIHDAHAARPYVSPIAWSFFHAMEVIASYSVTQLKILGLGAEADSIVDQQKILDVAIAALPEYKELIQEHGHTIFPFLIEQLEKRLLDEIRKDIDGIGSDVADVEKAAHINSLVERYQLSIEKASVEKIRKEI